MIYRFLESGTGRSILSLLAIALLFGLINLVVVGSQKLYHHEDQKKLDELKSVLDPQLREIKSIEEEIDRKESELNKLRNQMSSIKSDIDNIEKKYGSRGIPEREYAKYSQNIDKYNELVKTDRERLDSYNNYFDHYEAKLNDYNSKVDTANALSKKIGSTWYVLPVPRR